MKSAEALFICCALLVAGMICYASAFRNGSENAPATASTFGAPASQRQSGARVTPGPSAVALRRRSAARLVRQRVAVMDTYSGMQMAALDSPPRPGTPAERHGVRYAGSAAERFRSAALTGRAAPHLDLRPAGAVGDQPPKASPTATRTPSPTATATPSPSPIPPTDTPIPPTDTPAPVAAGTTATVWVTGYTLGGTTATGGQAGPGVCAVDPSYIPLGTQISIDGVGSCVAADTGPGVVGAHIDVWVPSYDVALGLTGWYTAHW